MLVAPCLRCRGKAIPAPMQLKLCLRRIRGSQRADSIIHGSIARQPQLSVLLLLLLLLCWQKCARSSLADSSTFQAHCFSYCRQICCAAYKDSTAMQETESYATRNDELTMNAATSIHTL
jgi:hypothetical protein